MKRHQIFFIILLISAFSSACGFIQTKARADQLVTQKDAETVLGAPMKLDTKVAAYDDTRCVYKHVNETEFAELTVIIQTLSTKEELDYNENSMKTIKGKYGMVRDIEGLGDSAWSVNRYEGSSQMIFVRKGSVEFHIIADGSEVTEATLDRLKTLASRVAEKL